MKKYLIFVLLILPSYCYALMNPYMFGITTSSASCGVIDGGTCTEATDADARFGKYLAELKKAAIAVAPAEIDICQIDANLKRFGSSSSVITVEIWSDDGGTEKTNTPDTKLATSSNSFVHSTLSTSYEAKSFTFSPAITITNGTKYWIAFAQDTASSTNYTYVEQNDADCTEEEELISTWGGTSWDSSGGTFSAISPITVYGE